MSWDDLRILSNTLRLCSVPLISFLPVDVYKWFGRVKLPSINTFTISIWFSWFDCFTIFSIFYEEIRLTTLFLACSYFSKYWIISSFVIFEFYLRKVDLRIRVLLSTISLWRKCNLLVSGSVSWLVLNLLVHILCLVNVSKTIFIYLGIISSTHDIF
jgi:hypothetical protein